jgi:hypothetical protein
LVVWKTDYLAAKLEGGTMATVVQNITPAELIGRFRGEIFAADPGYPEVLLFKVRDGNGGQWWFSTNYAEYSPSDPDVLLGKTVAAAEIHPSGGLTVGFSDASCLEVRPIPLPPGESGEDLETWDLIAPDGLVVIYGPGERWTLEELGRPPGSLRAPGRSAPPAGA